MPRVGGAASTTTPRGSPFWEAVLATLAILVWHLYSTVFNPDVYPMNPSWLTGKMPEQMYAAEHPEDLGRARAETAATDPGS